MMTVLLFLGNLIQCQNVEQFALIIQSVSSSTYSERPGYGFCSLVSVGLGLTHHMEKGLNIWLNQEKIWVNTGCGGINWWNV